MLLINWLVLCLLHFLLFSSFLGHYWGEASSLGEFGFLNNVWGLPARWADALPPELIVPSAAEQAEQHNRRTSSSRIRINF